jgi:hypothetical protein
MVHAHMIILLGSPFRASLGLFVSTKEKFVKDYHCSHYKKNDIDIIEALALQQGFEAVRGFVVGNIWKYSGRAGLKGEAEKDCDKIEYYLGILRKIETNFEGWKNEVLERASGKTEKFSVQNIEPFEPGAEEIEPMQAEEIEKPLDKNYFFAHCVPGSSEDLVNEWIRTVGVCETHTKKAVFEFLGIKNEFTIPLVAWLLQKARDQRNLKSAQIYLQVFSKAGKQGIINKFGSFLSKNLPLIRKIANCKVHKENNGMRFNFYS